MLFLAGLQIMYTLGIDVGSGYSKAVVCENGVLRSSAVMPSGGNYGETARNVVETVLGKLNISLGDVARTMTTGYGASTVDFADDSATDMACHGAAMHHLFPSVRTVIDIGSQYSRAVRLNEAGKVTYFVMNEKCAGGSGKFLQVIARMLKISLDEIGPLSLTATKPVEFTTACAVFAESEAVSRIAEGATPADIVAGIHKAMASKIATLVTRVGLAPDCAITGGGAKDLGLVQAMQTELATPILVGSEPQITAALGAALMAWEQVTNRQPL